MSDYRTKLGDLGIDVHKIRGVRGKVTCPKCSHTRKKKKDPCLSVDTEKGFYKCHNCDWHGTVRFDVEPREKKIYRIPTLANQTQCSDEILKWFMSRCISPSTLIKCNVMSGSTWMPQTQREEYCMQFNYMRNGTVVNIKHRDAFKNFRMEKDAELVFYGLDDLKEEDKYIVVVEGELDKLSFTECGVDYCLSVPNGASKQRPDGERMVLEYLDNCLDYFENDKIVILAVDNDDPGMILREELSRRLGKDRCKKVNFKDCKDANEYLIKYGPEELSKTIRPENLIDYPLDGVVDWDDLMSEARQSMHEGLSRGSTTGVFREFDQLMSFDGGKLCVVTGIPNSGKTPFVDILMIILSIRFGWKWGICSMENKPLKTYVVKIAEKIFGKFIRPGKTMDKDVEDKVMNFMSNHFFFIEANYDNNETDTLDFILSAAQRLVKKHGINGLTIDPWNKIEHQMKSGENETNYVSKALDQIMRFEQSNDLFTFLVAHPHKQKKTKGGEYEVPDLYSVSGSSNFFNKPDWGITVHRNYKTGLTEIHVNKAKWDHLGKVGRIALKYNVGNGRLGDPNEKLDFSNWLDSLVFIEDKESTSDDFIDYETEVFNGNDIPERAPF